MTRDLRSLLEDFSEQSGRELSRRAPDPSTEVSQVAGMVVRRRVRHAAGVGAGVLALALVGAVGVQQWAFDPRPAPPAVEPTPTVSAPPTPTPTATPTPTPTSTASGDASAPETPSMPSLVLGAGGAVDGFGADDDADDVIAHLTALLGAPPEVGLAGSCPGLSEGEEDLRWGNVNLQVRTDTGTVRGWSVQAFGPDDPAWDGPWSPVEARTVDGVRLGDPISTVRSVYPDLSGGEGRGGASPPFFWSVGVEPSTYGFTTDDTSPDAPVTSMFGGTICGE